MCVYDSYHFCLMSYFAKLTLIMILSTICLYDGSQYIEKINSHIVKVIYVNGKKSKQTLDLQMN